MTPHDAAAAQRAGTPLVDIREPDEVRRARIPGAVNHPLSRLDAAALPPGAILLCQSGMRCAPLAATHPVVEGGLAAWERAGLPVARDARAPLPIMRQVQMVAGALVVAGVLGGALVAPGFYALAGMVGAGLVVAGATGFCGMARLLAAMPWNRQSA